MLSRQRAQYLDALDAFLSAFTSYLYGRPLSGEFIFSMVNGKVTMSTACVFILDIGWVDILVQK